MELYVKTLLNGVYVENKCSLFGDEEIELTRSWYEQQVLDGYGSYSKSFSIPADSNNQEIFKYYDKIDANFVNTSSVASNNKLDPNYFIEARLVINSYEIVGNISVVSFSTKNNKPYSFNVNFYGDEKNLIKFLNALPNNKLNSLSLTNLSFTFNYYNVVNTWNNTGTTHFVPLFANVKPFTYRDSVDANNINTYYATSGITLKDLSVSYNMRDLLVKIFERTSLSLSFSTEIEKMLYEMYIMINTKVEYNQNLTNIYTESFRHYPTSKWGYMRITGSTYSVNGILPANEDMLSWDRLDSTGLSLNFYKALSAGKYTFKMIFALKKTLPYSNIESFNWRIDDYNNPFKVYASGVFKANEEIDVSFDLLLNAKVQFRVSYTRVDVVQTVPVPLLDEYGNHMYNYDSEGNKVYLWEVPPGVRYVYTETAFETGALSMILKASKDDNDVYDYKRTTINFPDMLISDFFVNFCKTFNIFFIYNSKTKQVKTYFKEELPSSMYNLNSYLIQDKPYTYSNQSKYKNINYQFADAKDVNNISYKTATAKNYGAYKEIYNYDVGEDKLEYKSIFTVVPRTELNKTNDANEIIVSTGIPLHTELNESLSKINTDYILFYKGSTITGLTYPYLFQNGSDSYTSLTVAPDYKSFNKYDYHLDFNRIKLPKDNSNIKYTTTFEFLLPYNILYKLKVYDYIFVNDVWWEISEITSNMRNGYTKITCTNLAFQYDLSAYKPITTTDNTTMYIPTTTTTTTQQDYSVNLRLIFQNYSSYDINYEWTIPYMGRPTEVYTGTAPTNQTSTIIIPHTISKGEQMAFNFSTNEVIQRTYIEAEGVYVVDDNYVAVEKIDHLGTEWNFTSSEFELKSPYTTPYLSAIVAVFDDPYYTTTTTTNAPYTTTTTTTPTYAFYKSTPTWYTSSSEACSQKSSTQYATFWTNTPTISIGTVLYTNPYHTVAFYGNNLWIVIRRTDGYIYKAVKISPVGVVLDIFNCPDITTTTTTPTPTTTTTTTMSDNYTLSLYFNNYTSSEVVYKWTIQSDAHETIYFSESVSASTTKYWLYNYILHSGENYAVTIETLDSQPLTYYLESELECYGLQNGQLVDSWELLGYNSLLAFSSGELIITNTHGNSDLAFSATVFDV